MYTFRDNNILVGEVWFDEEPASGKGVDVILYKQRSRPLDGVDYEDFSTMIIDLTKEEDELWGRVHKNDRYKIRRAADKDQVTHRLWSPDCIDLALIDKFADSYDQFAKWKGLTKLRRNRLNGYAESNSLYLSNLQTNDGEIIGWHSYVRAENRVRLLQSASRRGDESDTSSFKSMIGRVNRLHHWKDIVEFKKLGLATYDFGGWYTGDTDPDLLAINHFKEKFGGDIVAAVNFSRPITMKGRLYVTLRKIYVKYSKYRRSRSSRKKDSKVTVIAAKSHSIDTE